MRLTRRRLTSGAATAATTATTAATAGLGSRRPFLGFIDPQRPAAHLEAIRLLDCVLSFTGRHVHERKSAGTPGLAIVDEL